MPKEYKDPMFYVLGILVTVLAIACLFAYKFIV